ncbi:hypothetical protein [Agarilytica rhodophyticola]|uniref:hypothetical protein n=1 Tax=Agarilytica rhodophyticola TaxID=1737490 RepID=UPI001315A7C0|nr:hypothetical protein [Agarilytica rhodophyticola]
MTEVSHNQHIATTAHSIGEDGRIWQINITTGVAEPVMYLSEMRPRERKKLISAIKTVIDNADEDCKVPGSSS